VSRPTAPPTPGAARTIKDRVRGSLNLGAPAGRKPLPGAQPKLPAIRPHHGAVDQTMLTSGAPPEGVVAHVRAVLEGMGVELHQESEWKFRCVRQKRRGAVPAAGVAAYSVTGSAGSAGVRTRMWRGVGAC
jgi:protein-serine/threonine kinase